MGTALHVAGANCIPSLLTKRVCTVEDDIIGLKQATANRMMSNNQQNQTEVLKFAPFGFGLYHTFYFRLSAGRFVM